MSTALAPISGPISDGQPSTSLVAAPSRTVQLLRPIAAAVVLLEAQKESREVMKSLLNEGRDYGKIPGIDKPTLLKPGAEKFNNAYGLVPRFIVTEKEVDHDKLVPWKKTKAIWEGPKGQRRKVRDEEVHGNSYGIYRYVILCELVIRGTEEVVGSCIGSCSTLESKYTDRPREVENTILKMAQKRAYIGATLLAHSLSDEFTQDVEDMAPKGGSVPAGGDMPHAVGQDDDEDALPPVGSVAWARSYPLHPAVKKSLKIAAETMGACTGKELQDVINGCDTLLARKDSTGTREVKQAAEVALEALEEDRLLAEQKAPAGTPAAPTPPAQPGAAPAAETPPTEPAAPRMPAVGGVNPPFMD